MNLRGWHFVLMDQAGGGEGGAGAGAGAGSGAGAGTGAGAPPAGGGDWLASIQDEGVRTWATAKGFKDATQGIESAYNLEKLIGFDKAGRTIVLPKDDATPEELKAFRSKLGVPETIDGYKLPVPEGAPADFAKQAASWFHEQGVPPKAAEAIVAKYNGVATEMAKAQATQRAAQDKIDVTDLKTEWGAAYDKNLEMNMRFAAEFGLDAKMDEKDSNSPTVIDTLRETLGVGRLNRLLAKMSAGLGEHSVHGGGSSDLMTPAQASHQLDVLKSDTEWVNRYMAGGKKEFEEMQRLIALANPAPAEEQK